VFVANPLPGSFASIGMPPTDIVEELDQDLIFSSGLAWFDSKDGLDDHHINPSFHDKLKKRVNFEVRFSFKWNYWVAIP